ncbi:hypothetical protein MVEN_02446700 [Mycena venus]|uniref:Uncharacterized protein n=1 Tax=Mycena venus TaxID=2733690 RepID=A0A8H6WYN4_9AGAR|nr:hypothetical protein MVEN_02446700 [Mycena venus]
MATGTSPTRLATVADNRDGSWLRCGRFDGSEYYVKTRRGGDSPLPSDLVVDDWHLTTAATNTANSLSSCEEAYFLGKDDWLLVLHSSQTAWYPSQHGNGTGLDMKTKRKLYWTYIAAHPAHAGRSMAKWIAEAHKQALAFLKWCSFEAMTSPSTANVPFTLTASQELANMLASLHEKSVYLKDGEEGAAVDTPGVRDAQQGNVLSHPVDDHPVPGAETAAQESLKLRTALIAKVLAAKYSQQAAHDPSIVPYNRHTSRHRGIAFVLGLPLAVLVCSLPSSGGRLSLTEPSGVFYAVVATVAVGGLARYSLAGLWGHGHHAARAV